MTTVACVGLAVLDLVFGVQARPDRGRKAFADSLTVIGGGPAANAAVAVARLGGDARFFGRLGDDVIGDLIIDDFARWDVDTSGVRRIPSVSSPVSSIVVEVDGERTIVNHSEPGLFTPNDVVTDDDLTGADAVLADLLWPTGAVSAMHAARAVGIPGVLDFDEAPHGPIDAVLAAPTPIIFSAPALASVSDESDPGTGLGVVRTMTDSWLAVTLGSGGVRWLDAAGATHMTPAYDVAAIDTLGAGDVFHGAFALGLAERRPIEEVIRRASAVAALKCTRFGGRAGIPSAAELEEFLSSRPDSTHEM
ncbi:MAG: PfkB family carbohydrate kinase [Actinomycetota bacterium]|nr:PfkB family carbohydrate kinase [Actinomycetota bacterium]